MDLSMPQFRLVFAVSHLNEGSGSNGVGVPCTVKGTHIIGACRQLVRERPTSLQPSPDALEPVNRLAIDSATVTRTFDSGEADRLVLNVAQVSAHTERIGGWSTNWKERDKYRLELLAPHGGLIRRNTRYGQFQLLTPGLTVGHPLADKHFDKLLEFYRGLADKLTPALAAQPDLRLYHNKKTYKTTKVKVRLLEDST